MTYEEYKAKTHEMVNDISDLCNTSFVTKQMSLEEIIEYYSDVLQRIYAIARYPEESD